MIEAYMNATLEVLRLAGQMFLDRIDYELRRFAEDLHDFIYDLDRNPRRDWRERFDAFLADQSSRGRDISPESRLDLIAYLEVWERNVYGGPAQRALEASITRLQEPAAVPAEPASSYSVLPPRRPAEPKPPKRKPTWWRPPTGDRADFYRKLNDARSCIYDLERMLPAIANRIEAAKPDVPLEIDDELNAVEWLIWRHNDLMESAREIWLTKNLGQHEFTELELSPNPASLGLPLFTEDQQAERAKVQLKKIGVRIKQKIAFLDDVIFALEVADTAITIASFAMAGGILVQAFRQGGKVLLVKTVAKMAAAQVAGQLAGEATERTLRAAGLDEEQFVQVQGAVEIISTVLVLRRLGKLKVRPNAPAPAPRAAPPKPEPDRSWKNKISGTAQKTGTDGHQFRVYREAIKEAKKLDVVSVDLNHGYNRGLGLPPKTISPNRRPDVLSIYKDRTVKRIEVQSKTDRRPVLQRRNLQLDVHIRAQGFTPLPPLVIEPTKSSS